MAIAKPQTVSRELCFRCAAICGADPRTVADYLTGKRRTSLVAAKAIDAALVQMGVSRPVAKVGA